MLMGSRLYHFKLLSGYLLVSFLFAVPVLMNFSYSTRLTRVYEDALSMYGVLIPTLIFALPLVLSIVILALLLTVLKSQMLYFDSLVAAESCSEEYDELPPSFLRGSSLWTRIAIAVLYLIFPYLALYPVFSSLIPALMQGTPSVENTIIGLVVAFVLLFTIYVFVVLFTYAARDSREQFEELVLGDDENEEDDDEDFDEEDIEDEDAEHLKTLFAILGVLSVLDSRDRDHVVSVSREDIEDLLAALDVSDEEEATEGTDSKGTASEDAVDEVSEDSSDTDEDTSESNDMNELDSDPTPVDTQADSADSDEDTQEGIEESVSSEDNEGTEEPEPANTSSKRVRRRKR